MSTYFERMHEQASQALGPAQVEKMTRGKSWAWNSPTLALWWATYPAASDGILRGIVYEAREEKMGWGLEWFHGAMALQNPNYNKRWLAEDMSIGRVPYLLAYPWCLGGDKSPHWMYEAGLKNPLLSLLDCEQPGQLADFLQSVDKMAKARRDSDAGKLRLQGYK